MGKTLKLVVAGAGVLGVIAGFVLTDSFLTRFEAARFLADVRALRPGRASLQDVLHLRTKYKRFATLPESECDPDKCRVSFRFDNRWLFRIHAVPPTLFAGGITARDGMVSRIDLNLLSGLAYTAQVIDANVAPFGPPFEITLRESRPGVAVLLKVQLTPATPEKLRQEAYLFNLACLTRFGGCNDAHTMLPAMETGATAGGKNSTR